LLPLLEPLACDLEYVVRQHVALQFPPLCRFLLEANPDAGYRVLLDKMVPLVTKLVSDDQHEVRTAASESLVEMAALVKLEDQGQHILTIVLPLAHDDDNEQFRISAVALYNGLAEHLGPELCQQFCVPELISLSEDPVFRVRKSTALSFSNVCKTAGQELSRDRLIPSFQRLARDDIWGVRKACAECLVSVALALAPADRGPKLIPLFDSFVKDSSRWVRMAAYQSLGPFLAALDKEQITEELVEHFTSMATTASMQLGGSGEVDIKFHCAFNFPAVVSILGASQWTKLSPTFELLHNDTFWKIRRSFAYSLHELARLLGQGITETQLATAFDSYLHDVQDVRLGAMLHFADFLEHVSPSFRESYLPVLAEFDSFDQSTKWRFREVLSGQLAQLCRTFTPEATFSVIYPLVFKLVTDPVAVVRQESYHACPLLVARLSSNAEWVKAVVEKFVTLAKSSHYKDRQCYLKICASFLAPSSCEEQVKTTGDDGQESAEPSAATANSVNARAFFSSQLATVFFTLALDPVSNVRCVFAETVVDHQEFFRGCVACPEVLREQLEKSFQNVEELGTLLTERVREQAEAQAAADATVKPAVGGETIAEAGTNSQDVTDKKVDAQEAAVTMAQEVVEVESIVPSAEDAASDALVPLSPSSPTVAVEAADVPPPAPFVPSPESEEVATSAPQIPAESAEAASDHDSSVEATSPSSPEAVKADPLGSPTPEAAEPVADASAESSSPRESVEMAVDPVA
ncbi:hypothetical protein BBJ28_00026069, partial [Nothophytophthora sp. Chile5]